VLAIDGLSAGYGAAEVLHDVSIAVHGGEIVSVLGSNGAGKTTLLRVICGLVPVRRGTIVFDGVGITRARCSAIARAGIGLVPEDRDLFVGMSVDDNLLIGTSMLPRARRRARVGELYDLLPNLRGWSAQAVGSLSGGQRALVNLAVGIAAEPKLLLVDEPSAGLSPQAAELMFSSVAELGAGGTAILLVEQDAYAALRIADRGYIIEQGAVAIEGGSASLLGEESIRKAYLGL
jgi:branched-chain amino acid transport system ATP-binding protein